MNEAPYRMSYETFTRTAGVVQEALLALAKAVDECGLDKVLTELVKLRASQINGCAFCLQLHLNVARKLGVPREKVDLVAVWRETSLFSDRERAALAWAEALTSPTDHNTRALAGVEMKAQFSEQEILYLTVAIGTINQWNRIAIGLAFPPPIQSRTSGGVAK